MAFGSSIIYVGSVNSTVKLPRPSWTQECPLLVAAPLPATVSGYCKFSPALGSVLLLQHCRVLRPFAFSFCCCCFLFPAMCFYCINFYGLLPPFSLLLLLLPLLPLPLLRFLAAAFVLLCVCPKVIKWIGFSRIISILNPVSKSAQAMPSLPLPPLSLSVILPHCSSCPREALWQLFVVPPVVVVVVAKVASFSRIKLFCKVCWDLFGDSICNCFCFPCVSSACCYCNCCCCCCCRSRCRCRCRWLFAFGVQFECCPSMSARPQNLIEI